jgi:hypothetical protein
MRIFKTTSLIKYYLIGIFFLMICKNVTGQNLSSDFTKGEILVQLNSGINANQLTQVFTHIGLTQKQKVSDILNIWLFLYNTEVIQSEACLNLIKQNNFVLTAQFNHFVYLNAIPNDPEYTNQYGMNKIQASSAWDFTTGGSTVQNDHIVVAILDSGFDINHQDIDFWKNNMEVPENGIDDDGNGYIDDYDGWNANGNNGTITSDNHGTHIAGIVGAKGNNEIGVAGVNWNVKIMPIQAFGGNEAAVVAGYSYVLKMRQLYNQTNGASGAFIVVTNVSFSTHVGDPESYPLWCGIYDALGSEGILNVNAPWNIGDELGNDFTDVPGMCSSQYLIVVSNTDQNDELNGQAPWSKTYVDLVAPGTNIYSTLPGNLYGNLTGTSMAAPHVTGAIALMYAAACDQLITNYKTNPSSVALSMRQLLLNWTDPIYQLLPDIGYGRLNVYRSIVKMSEQYDYDLYVTGTEISSNQHDAINNMTVENYIGIENSNVVFRAGNSIEIKPETSISSDSNGSWHAFIDRGTFDCAIPFQPLAVDLISPSSTYCGGGYAPITCNAVPTGGKPPYSFVWYTKISTNTNWITHDLSSPNIAFGSVEDFYVQVQVTDERGVSALSNIAFVDCIDAAMVAPLDTNTIAHATIDPGNSGKILAASEKNIQSDNLRQSFNAYPNPSTGIVRISFTLFKASPVTIQISDSTGEKIVHVETNGHYEIGKHTIDFDGSNLPAGLYFYTIITDEGINAIKLIRSK